MDGMAADGRRPLRGRGRPSAVTHGRQLQGELKIIVVLSGAPVLKHPLAHLGQPALAQLRQQAMQCD
jgi:hypothetical protein